MNQLMKARSQDEGFPIIRSQLHCCTPLDNEKELETRRNSRHHLVTSVQRITRMLENSNFNKRFLRNLSENKRYGEDQDMDELDQVGLMAARKIVKKTIDRHSLMNLRINTSLKDLSKSACKSTKKVPLPLYPCSKKNNLSNIKIDKRTLKGMKFTSTLSAHDPDSPTKSIYHDKFTNPSTNDVFSVSDESKKNVWSMKSKTSNNSLQSFTKPPTKPVSGKDKRRQYQLLCKGKIKSEHETSPGLTKSLTKNMIRFSSQASSPILHLKEGTPKIKSIEKSLPPLNLKSKSMAKLRKMSGHERAIEYSPVKFCQNEVMPMFEHANRAPWASQKVIEEVPEQKEGSNKYLLNDQEELIVNDCSVFDKSFDLKEQFENEPFLAAKENFLDSILSESEKSDCLSVSISEDSMLCEMVEKPTKKKHRVIKLNKKKPTVKPS